jgi:periplasmic protein CpxP/Spy
MKALNFTTKTLVTAAALFGLAGSAAAQAPATAPADGQRAHASGQQHHKRGEHMAMRQQKLHDTLQLTASQESAWAAFVAATKPAGDAMRGHRADRAAMHALPAPQRLEKAIERSKQRTAKMEQRLAALKSFYAVLSPAQQKAFDAQAMHGGQRWKGGMHHRG